MSGQSLVKTLREIAAHRWKTNAGDSIVCERAADRIEALEQDSANLQALTGELATRDAIERTLRARIEALEARLMQAEPDAPQPRKEGA